jgi:hypothetical protein
MIVQKKQEFNTQLSMNVLIKLNNHANITSIIITNAQLQLLLLLRIPLLLLLKCQLGLVKHGFKPYWHDISLIRDKR